MDDEDEASLAALASYCRDVSPFGELFPTLAASGAAATAVALDEPGGALIGSDDGKEAPLSLSELHALVDGLDADTMSQEERECNALADSIRASASVADSLLEQIQLSRASLTRMSAQHASVSRRAKALHRNCTALLAERERLHNAVAKISAPLLHFDEVARISLMLGLKPLDGAKASDVPRHAGSKAIDRPEDFWPIHRRICECVDYLEAHPSFVDSARYLDFFAQLERKGLQLSKDKVVGTITKETASIAAAVTAAHARVEAAEKRGNATALAAAERALLEEMPILDARFRAAIAPLRGVIVNLETRALGGQDHGELSTPSAASLESTTPSRSSAVARELLRECERAYCAARRGLLESVVPLRIAAARRQCLASSSGAAAAPSAGASLGTLGALPAATASAGTQPVLRLMRVACAYLASVCDTEQVSVLLFTVTFYANHAHNLTRSP
jgi:hypothetical protein